MLKLEPRCKVCKLIKKGDDKLLKRLYGSSAYRGKMGESVRSIWRAYSGEFTELTLRKHLKFHQALSEDDLSAALNRRTEKGQVGKLLDDAFSHGQVRQLIIDKGYKGIKSGKIKLRAADVRAAAKDAADIEEKQKDRSLQVMEMIMRVASGDLSSGIGTPTEPTRETAKVVSSTN